jgi:hypothetical protein
MGAPLLALLLAAAAASQSSTVSLWSDSTTPGLTSANDNQSAELGVKFKSDVDGAVMGIRFYKGTGNTGTHVGNLWSASGTNLAAVTFTGETASGWQHMNFANPVPITAGTTYVASYLCPAGHYAADQGYFNAAYDIPPLHALQDGAQGGNGVYHYSATSVFPDATFMASNYYVDVIFSPAAATPPTTTPTSSTSSSTKRSGSEMNPCGSGLAGAGGGTGIFSAASLALALLAAGARRR